MIRILLSLSLALWFCSASAAPSLAEEMRLAARLHKAGETEKAVAIWQRRASEGQADAAYNLAVIHHYGDGVPLDYAAAMRWYRVAAEAGDKPAQFQIGLMYQTGQGVTADPAEAHRWFTRHLQHHLHHEHDPQMVAWRQQALALIDDRDRRETLAAQRQNGALVLADLRRRAGLTVAPTLASATSEHSLR
ncbi:tetratricopeptide repeat protein [Azonexus sp. IMCC34839]|uniref:tetratricopeptide repeat protein n=1 Tax=Azonexus sp. IMCC34839 TaxID=3133695 RepID=UPI003999A8FB